MDPHSFLKDVVVEEALRTDKGTDVRLSSWEFENFLKEGDNLATYVTSIKVKYNKDGQEATDTYIAKINPGRDNKDWNAFMYKLFAHEIFYFSDLKPIIESMFNNKIELHVPTVYALSSERNKEVMITNDLRKLGYRLHSRKIGLDVPHLTLIMTELARLHAGSYVALQKRPTLLEDYPIVTDDIMVVEEGVTKPGQEMLVKIYGMQVVLLSKIVSLYPEFKHLAPWIASFKDLVIKTFSDVIKDYSPKFRIIGHGDLWNSNLLFKYDDSVPTGVMFVDFQACRISSPAVDFHQLFYTSVSGPIRTENLLNLLRIYYDEYERVLQLASIDMPFSFEDLHKEYKSKILYGIIYGLAFGITTVLEADEMPDYSNLETDEIEEHVQSNAESVIKNLKKNPRFEDRFLYIMRDVEEYIKDNKK